jgi:hypothetical protein
MLKQKKKSDVTNSDFYISYIIYIMNVFSFRRRLPASLMSLDQKRNNCSSETKADWRVEPRKFATEEYIIVNFFERTSSKCQLLVRSPRETMEIWNNSCA